MKTLTKNSAEFVKANIYYAQDHSTARIYSIDICKQIEDSSSKDEAFNEAVDYVTEYLANKGYVVGEYEEDNNGCSMTWEKR